MPEAPIGVLRAQRGQDLNLLAGQLYFGNQPARVRTLLGSCVAVTLWNPKHQIGGMCHYLLPSRPRTDGQAMDGRFGDEALSLMVDMLTSVGTLPQDYEAHLYGGADTLQARGGVKFNIGERNIEQGWSLIDRYGFSLQGIDVGDHVPRNVLLDFNDGSVTMRRGELRTPIPGAKKP